MTLNPSFKFDLSEAADQFETNSISYSAKYFQPKFLVNWADKRWHKHQSRGGITWKVQIKFLIKYAKVSFSKCFIVGSFCILSPHISGGKQKGSNKSETLKLWRREISSQNAGTEIFSVKNKSFGLSYQFRNN